jgi:hypothetical protein
VNPFGIGLASWYPAEKLNDLAAPAASGASPAGLRTVTAPVGDWVHSPADPSIRV